MIQRTVLLRLEPEHQPKRVELGGRILSLLRGLTMVERADVAVWEPELEPDHPGWDLAVTVYLADLHALAAYAADPIHAAFVRTELAPRVAWRKATSLALVPEPSDC
jgi:hypothetical protein